MVTACLSARKRACVRVCVYIHPLTHTRAHSMWLTGEARTSNSSFRSFVCQMSESFGGTLPPLDTSTQESGIALAAPLGLRVSIDGGNHLLR
ncbi:hypothetical protein EVAR_26642_1 [Eumeta japonica]|uniref:Uncharacterized protein n=1 Tax=Eumeta variegata TaxID=151549 RepID=A0A4C1VLZ6_EUMVA|nr:hypothetical protein EVAR_26642_1 [Eumeta japonica]